MSRGRGHRRGGRGRPDRPGRRGGRRGGGRAFIVEIPEGAIAQTEIESLPEVAYLDRLTPAREEQLRAFSEQEGLGVKDFNLLNRALSHKSYTNELGLSHNEQNEKLEFFGDGVLGLVVNEHLFRRFPDAEEGDLAKIKSQVVSEATLDRIARKIRLERLILLGRGEEASGGRTRAALLADCLEAVIGATYLDAGLDAARAFVLRYIDEEVGRAATLEGRSDYKSLLQEHAQRSFRARPSYRLLRSSGPEHAKQFRVEAEAAGQRAQGEGRTKKEAEQAAAEALYRRLISGRGGDRRRQEEDADDRRLGPGRRIVDRREEGEGAEGSEAAEDRPAAEETGAQAGAEAPLPEGEQPPAQVEAEGPAGEAGAEGEAESRRRRRRRRRGGRRRRR